MVTSALHIRVRDQRLNDKNPTTQKDFGVTPLPRKTPIVSMVWIMNCGPTIQT